MPAPTNINTIKINGKEYEIIQFSSRLTNRPTTMKGASLAQGYIAIAGDNRIYNTVCGKPILRGRFTNLSDAVRFAEGYISKYKDYFDIWSVYPEADVFALCKYTVPGGAITFELLALLDKLEIINNDIIAKADYTARQLATKWRV